MVLSEVYIFGWWYLFFYSDGFWDGVFVLDVGGKLIIDIEMFLCVMNYLLDSDCKFFKIFLIIYVLIWVRGFGEDM